MSPILGAPAAGAAPLLETIAVTSSWVDSGRVEVSIAWATCGYRAAAVEEEEEEGTTIFDTLWSQLAHENPTLTVASLITGLILGVAASQG
jgi:hypothetical protein